MAQISNKYSENYLCCMHVISVVVCFMAMVYAINKRHDQRDIKNSQRTNLETSALSHSSL
jgi:hypothetical protein